VGPKLWHRKTTMSWAQLYEDKNMEKYGKIGEYLNHLKSSETCTTPLEFKVTEVN
jgi:hypothetical protein